MSNRISIVAGPGASDPQPPTDHEAQMMSMTQAERNEYIERARWAAAKAAHDEKQADLDRRINESIQRATYTQGGVTHRVVVNGDETMTTVEGKEPVGRPGWGYMATDPESLAINVGGIELSPEQAKVLLADGTISRQQYSDAVTAAMQPYRPGYKHSFR
jgi:hypothetical protein